MTKKTSPAYRASKEETIPINKLHPFSNHPFHIRHDLEFSELVDSISESGIITPIIVRPKVGVGYEVISGHRRWEACKELGIESIPARVEYIDDDEATILMVNSNIQREHVLPSEKAFAYKMRMEAMKHQGKATSSQLGTKLRTLDAMGKEVDESRNQIHRYIRLTYLIPSILQMVDDGRIAFNPAVEISYAIRIFLRRSSRAVLFLPYTQSAIYRAELQGAVHRCQGTVWDSAGSNEFVAEKSMVRCTEQGLHYLHRGGNHGCTELCQPESHAPDGGTGKAGRAYRAQATGAW